ncbi:MAG: hypothetical protein IK013_03425 [Bacteroidales bacterium]|nr:hypothetical protein [Bacteroidales bacterium]
MTDKARTTLFGILKLIPFAIVTAMIVLFWLDDFRGFMLAIFFFWITLPAVVLSIVFFIMGLRWRDIWQRIAVVWGGLNLLILILYFLVQTPNQRCNPDIMAKHYEEHHTEMEELHQYVQSAIADSCEITLEFNGNKLEMFDVDNQDNYLHYGEKEAILHKDSLLLIAGLSQEEYDNICKQLKDMGCIGIEFSQFIPERLKIRFRRVGWGLYTYTILNRPMSDEEKASAMNNWVAIPYNDHCWFNFHGGAVGQESFPEKVKEDFLKKHKPW